VTMTRVKFCGLTQPADAAYAATLGASYIGVILTESARMRGPVAAREIFEAAPAVSRVGVFRHAAIEDLLEDARTAAAGTLQLHGRFTSEELARLREGFDGELWSVIPMEQTGRPLVDSWGEIADAVDAVVLDTSVGGRTGGTGSAFHWATAAPFVQDLSCRTRIVLAGGLTPSNVAEAVRILRPSVVDVSSGVESEPGVKDRSLMRAFAQAVGSASIE